jgi:hypothetical protein
MKLSTTIYTGLIGCALSLTSMVPAQSGGQTLKVDCNPRPPSFAELMAGGIRELGRAIQSAQPGDTIEVSGTCEEQVTIDFGPLTIDGGGEAVIDGSHKSAKGKFNGLVTVDGGNGVILKGLTIRNSPDEGVLAVRGANLRLEQVLMKDNGTGMLSSNAGVEIVDSAFRNNLGSGLLSLAGTNLIFRGEVESQGNGWIGTLLSDTNVEIIGGHVRMRDNGPTGIVLANSNLNFPVEGPSAPSNSLEVTGNMGPGIFLSSGQLVIFGPQSPHGNTLIRSADNGGPGIILAGRGIFANPWAVARVVVENNPVGMVVAENSNVMNKGGLEISGNFGPGLVADAAGTIDLAGESLSFIESNGGPDMVLEFGSRATIKGVDVGVLVCDPTVLVRGTVACP